MTGAAVDEVADGAGDLWVFGYGSLMWNPGVPTVEMVRARIHGYRRALCVRSYVHRGTEESPGLVLGLDRGGSCTGMAFRVPEAARSAAVEALRARELVTHVYKERRLPIRLADGRVLVALCYVIDRAHIQYAGALSSEEAALIVAHARGRSGENIDYVMNTLEHLRSMGIRDHWLEDVGRSVARLRAADSTTA
ncbi:gamma-glutamylcyclotransferase [Xaviernesmea oryzae]|uniref:glutathione-specific gamma-glutamylcyclotransferase n=1 Tax=Xaviernesmea oryzae TaxID=464029 RepID=A0A1Q9B292_9HYPH|nr:gamma-glutamylcyclotransferase [Xaviernesmea oryzae]OLP62125.1 gamma-glutamylcyclotransferase [Xaviernesmea oryzae]SEL88224.1 cation transport protein ChaC [Xaviernesmea oryzae]